MILAPNYTDGIEGMIVVKRANSFGLVHIPNIIDPRGNLTAGEFGRTIPFEAKRYFVIYQVPLVQKRGAHAHRLCHQLLISVRGHITVMADDGFRKEEFRLDRPDIGLYLPPMTWAMQYEYSPDAVLLVFASHYYDASDYIREYEEFLRQVKNLPA